MGSKLNFNWDDNTFNALVRDLSTWAQKVVVRDRDNRATMVIGK